MALPGPKGSSATSKTESSALLPPQTARSARYESLDFVRLVGAVHIWFYHVYGAPTRFAQWGAHWVSFFFLLSGFGAALSAIGRRSSTFSYWDMLPCPRTLARRAVAVFPTYWAALILAVVVKVGVTHKLTFFGPQLVVEALAINMWWPWDALHSAPGVYNIPGWFVGVLATYWLLERALVELAVRCSRAPWGVGYAAACVSIVLWAVFSPWTTVMWELQRGPQQPHFWTPVALNAPAWVQQYFAGMLLACALKARGDTPLPLARCLASVASVAFAALTIGLFWEGAATLAARRSGMLLPLFALLVAGLSSPLDPLTRALSTPPLPMLGEFALGCAPQPAHRVPPQPLPRPVPAPTRPNTRRNPPEHSPQPAPRAQHLPLPGPDRRAVDLRGCNVAALGGAVGGAHAVQARLGGGGGRAVAAARAAASATARAEGARQEVAHTSHGKFCFWCRSCEC